MNKEIRIRPTPGPLPNWEGVDFLAILPRASLADSLCPGLLSVAPTGLQYAAPSGAWNQYGEGAKPQRRRGEEFRTEWNPSLPRAVRIYAEQSSDCYGLLREVTRKFAQI